jgi:hypothetical protein
LISTATQIGSYDFLRMAPKHASAVPSGRAFGGLGEKNEKKRKKVLTFLLGALSFACRKSTKAVRSSRTRFWVFPRLSDRAASFLP